MKLPSKPLPLRLLNAAGAAADAIGLPLLRLDDAALLDRARRTTGLADFGADTFREPLRRLLDAFEREAQLSLLGRIATRIDLLRLLENRLRIVDTVKRHPEIERAEIRSPIFILGLPRTGTSILHELLAQDPANRVPLSWEVMYAWPPPDRATGDVDPRIARVNADLAQGEKLLPGIQGIHRMGAELPQECVAITSHEFTSVIFSTTHHVPGYQQWLEGTDHRPAYAWHRRHLQYLQWHWPAERWVLKSPGHLWSLDALLAVYPDARIIQTHRDPAKVVASLASLISLVRSMCSERVDPAAVAAEWAPLLARGLRATTDQRARGTLPDDQVFDLQFGEFVGNEITMIRRVYQHFAMPFTPEAEARMTRYLAANPKDKGGGHRYAPGDFGLDADEERRRFADYVERFRIPPERG